MLRLKEQGYHTIAIAPVDAYSKRIERTGIPFIPIKMKTNRISIWGDVSFMVQLLTIYLKYKPDLIFNYTIKANIFGNFAAFFAGNIQTISVVPGRGFTFNKKNWLYFLVKILYKISLSFTSGVWFLNEEDQRLFIKEAMVHARRTLLLPGEGVDTNYFLPAHPKITKQLDAPVFLLSGRMLWEKGVKGFVEAARIVKKKYPLAQFHLLGFLDDEDSRVVPTEIVQNWVAEGVVSFMGVADDVRPFFHQADCFVLPSYYGEGLPRTILEAASMQIPVITTDHRGCRRAVMDRESGFLVQPKNAKDLAEKILAFIRLPLSERNKMGQKGRKLVRENFEASIVENIYVEEVDNLLGNKSKPNSTLSTNEILRGPTSSVTHEYSNTR